MAAREVGPRIRLAMSGLTEKEQQIARYCLQAGGEIGRLSIHEIAAAHNVSAAMVVKLAQHLGFTGFRQMKQALLDYSRLPQVDLHEELSPSDGVDVVVEKVFKTAMNALVETMEVLDRKALQQAAKVLRQAASVTIIGVGGSGAIALDAHHKFLRIGLRSYFTTDTHFMSMNSVLMGPRDAVFGVSHSGRTQAVLEAFRLAKQQGATTILITNTPRSPTTPYADIVLCSVAQGSPINGENAAARIAQLNILDALFVLVAQSSYEDSLEKLDRTIGAVSSLRA